MTDIETSYETGGQDRNYYICTNAADPVDIPLLPLPPLATSSYIKIKSICQKNITQITILQTTTHVLTCVFLLIYLKVSEILLKFYID